MAHNARGQGLILGNVSAGYHEKIIVGGVSFSVPTERMTVLAGANDYGKPMLFSIVTCISQSMDGSILLDDKAIHEQPAKVLFRRPEILPQSPLLPEDSAVYELVSRRRFSWQNFIRQWNDADGQMVEDALKLTGTQEFAYLPVEKLSGG